MEFLPQSQVGIEKIAVLQLESQGHLGMCAAAQPVGKGQGLTGEENSSMCSLLLNTTFQRCPDCIYTTEMKTH